MVTRVHQCLAYFKLCSAIRHRKGDVVYGACTLTRRLSGRKSFEVNRIGTIAIWHDEAADITLHFSLFITHELEQLGTGINVVKPHTCATEATNSDILRHTRTHPWRTFVVFDLDECKAIAIRTVKTQAFGTKHKVSFKTGYAFSNKAVFPEAE